MTLKMLASSLKNSYEYLKNKQECYSRWYFSTGRSGMIYFGFTEVYYWIFQNNMPSIRTIVLCLHLQLWKQFSNSFVEEYSFSEPNDVAKKHSPLYIYTALLLALGAEDWLNTMFSSIYRTLIIFDLHKAHSWYTYVHLCISMCTLSFRI